MHVDTSLCSLTQATHERIRLDILVCRPRPGQRLKINDLCAALSVSLSAVREALSRLIGEGLVVAEPQRGFRVAPISVEDLEDLTRTRTEIEGLCLRSAIESGDLGWESRIVAAFHRLIRTPIEGTGSGPVNFDWATAHSDFHEALVAGCSSPRLLSMRRLLHLHNERYRWLAASAVDCRTYDSVEVQHRGLMEAAIAREADRAVALMADHVARTAGVLLSAVDAARPPPAQVPAASRFRLPRPPRSAARTPRKVAAVSVS